MLTFFGKRAVSSTGPTSIGRRDGSVLGRRDGILPSIRGGILTGRRDGFVMNVHRGKLHTKKWRSDVGSSERDGLVDEAGSA